MYAYSAGSTKCMTYKKYVSAKQLCTKGFIVLLLQKNWWFMIIRVHTNAENHFVNLLDVILVCSLDFYFNGRTLFAMLYLLPQFDRQHYREL